MTDRPILFSAPMIRALLDGRKTQTRRVLKPQPSIAHKLDGLTWWKLGDRPDSVIVMGDDALCAAHKKCVGDRLWVREAWRGADVTNHLPPREIQGACCWYEADGNAPVWKGKLRPSMFMPRTMSRLTLIVEGVKVERLQSISDEDAKAEGAIHAYGEPYSIASAVSARRCFELIWKTINGDDSWDANHWVTAISFRVIKANIDSPEAAQ